MHQFKQSNDELLKIINKLEQETKIQSPIINAANVELSKTDLLFNEEMISGNKRVANGQFRSAIVNFDNAIRIKPGSTPCTFHEKHVST